MGEERRVHGMRACVLAYTFYETDSRVIRYAEALQEHGYDVEVLCLRHPGEDRERRANGVRISRIQDRTMDETSPYSYLARVMLFLLRSSLVLSFRHVRRPYSLLHVHSMPDFLVFATWLPRLTGAKIILDIHDLLPELYAEKYGGGRHSWVHRALLLLERLSCRFAHHVIAANDLWKERLESRSVRRGKCTSFLNFPDTSVFCRRPKSRQDGRLVMLYPGTLSRHQGVDIALRAFARIRKDVPELHFAIYGEGTEKKRLSQLVNELGLEDRVTINRLLPLGDIARVMTNADIGVVPKRRDSFGNEAFSTKILEFMAVGVPVIVSDTVIDRFYFNDSVVRFFRSGDAEDLADAILLLARSEDLRTRLAENARALVAKYDWQTHKAGYIALATELVRGGRGSGGCSRPRQ